jgi:hypothetical protein
MLFWFDGRVSDSSKTADDQRGHRCARHQRVWHQDYYARDPKIPANFFAPAISLDRIGNPLQYDLTQFLSVRDLK